MAGSPEVYPSNITQLDNNLRKKGFEDPPLVLIEGPSTAPLLRLAAPFGVERTTQVLHDSPVGTRLEQAVTTADSGTTNTAVHRVSPEAVAAQITNSKADCTIIHGFEVYERADAHYEDFLSSAVRQATEGVVVLVGIGGGRKLSSGKVPDGTVPETRVQTRRAADVMISCSRVAEAKKMKDYVLFERFPPTVEYVNDNRLFEADFSGGVDLSSAQDLMA